MHSPFSIYYEVFYSLTVFLLIIHTPIKYKFDIITRKIKRRLILRHVDYISMSNIVYNKSV